jgi:acetyl-CoA carboxylase carboxyl transferase subunit beta
MKEILKRHPRYREAPQEFAGMPDNLWVRCPRCRELLYAKEQEQAGKVCSKCKFHFQITAYERLDLTLDGGTFQEHDKGLCAADPLNFRSLGEAYVEKLRDYAERAGTNEAFVYGMGTIQGQDVVVGATEFQFCGGSMGAAFGEKVARAIELGGHEGLPVVLFSNSGGARMQEGAISLLQMAKTVAVLDRYKASGLPYISVMSDPCLGGTTASFAMLGDVNIAEPAAYIGFAGRRVIEQTMRQKLPADAATAEFLVQHGMIDMVVPRAELPGVIARLLRIYMARSRTQAQPELVSQHA